MILLVQLHDRLMASVDSTKFLNQLQSLQADGASCNFPFKEASGFHSLYRLMQSLRFPYPSHNWSIRLFSHVTSSYVYR